MALVLLVLVGGCAQAASEPQALDAGSTPTSPASDHRASSVSPHSEGRVAAVDAVAWPRPDTNPPAARCAYRYPDELSDRANAFDATVVGVDVGKYSHDHAARPATVTVSLNEVFKGSQQGTAVLSTWDFSLPQNPERIVGVRILASAGPTMDLMGCGFTQPYSQKAADMWRDTFAR